MPQKLRTSPAGAVAVAGGGAVPGTSPAGGRRRPLGQRLTPYLLLVLPLVLLALALGYPLVRQLVMSFQEFGLAQQFGRPPTWVGLQNYTDALSDPYFWTVTARSIAFCAVCACVTMAVGVGFALLLQSVATVPRLLLQSALLLAWAMPVISALQVFTWLADPRYGLVNWVLTSLGFSGFEGYAWIADNPWTFYLVAAVEVVWTSAPLVTLTTYAALTQVDDAVLEASELDGAGAWTRVRHVVLPLISPVVGLMLMLQIIWDMRVFTQISVLQKTATNNDATHLLGTYIYSTGIGEGDYGAASALAMVMLVLVLVLTWRYLRTLLRQGDF